MVKLLSICIPTFNRAESLEITLGSLVHDPGFCLNEDIEIVISDNASTDETASVAQKYGSEFPGRIHYHCNVENVRDKNFFVALSLGTGEFLKLHNDTLVFVEGALLQLLQELKVAKQNGWTPFLLNGAWRRKGAHTICSTRQDLLKTVSFYTTWIGGFFIRKDDFLLLEDFSRRAETSLQQVDVLYRLLSERDAKFVVLNGHLINVRHPATRGGYNFAQVFLRNYEAILKEHFDPVSDKKIVKKEMQRVLYLHVLPWVFQPRNVEGVNYDTHDFEKIVQEMFTARDLLRVRIGLVCRRWERLFYRKYKSLRGILKMVLGIRRKNL